MGVLLKGLYCRVRALGLKPRTFRLGITIYAIAAPSPTKTGRQADIVIHRQIQTDRQTVRQTDRHTHRHTDIVIHRQIQTDRQGDRQTDRQTDSNEATTVIRQDEMEE